MARVVSPFKSAIDSAPLTDDVKLTYLKRLESGKAKTTIAEFTYCGTMYKDALKTLERKFGQPQAVASAYLDKLANYPPVKMHNSDSIISYSATVLFLTGWCFPTLELSAGSVERFAHEPSSSKTKVGNDVIDVDNLKKIHPLLEPIPFSKYSYSNVEMILGQDVFYCILPMKYFEADRLNTPIVVRLPLGWVLSGPLPSTTGLFSTCFKAVTSSQNDSILADQIRNWSDWSNSDPTNKLIPAPQPMRK